MAQLNPVSTGDPHVPAHNAERTEINALQTALNSKITAPGGAATGDLLRWDGTAWVTTETRFFEGVGNPNGVVAAPVGSRYVDKAGTIGAVDWVKSTGGDSNTGWTSSVGALAPIGQRGTITISGASSKVKSRSVPLDPAIFQGAAPSQVLVTATGSYSDLSHVYVASKGANSFVLSARHIDNVAYTAAAVITVDFFAII